MKYQKHGCSCANSVLTLSVMFLLMCPLCFTHMQGEEYFILGSQGQFRLEGISGGLKYELLLTAGSGVRSYWDAQDFFQLILENLQRQRCCNLSGQPAPLLVCLHGKNAFLYLWMVPFKRHLHNWLLQPDDPNIKCP